MKTNLVDHPPECGKALVLKRNRNILILGLIVSPTLTFLFAKLLFYHGLKLDYFTYALSISILGGSSWFYCCLTGLLNPKTGILTIDTEGIKYFTAFGCYHSYAWNTLSKIQLTYQSINNFGRIDLLSIKTVSAKRKTIPISGLGVKPNDLLKLIEQWHRYYCGNLSANPAGITT